MPIKLIGTIILLILVTIFAGVNLDNKCDITFVFYTFKDVPVFMTVIISFVIGLVIMLPFTFGRKKKSSQGQTNQKPENSAPKEDSKTLFDFKIKRETSKDTKSTEKKSPFKFGKKTDKKDSSASNENTNSKESSSNSENDKNI